MRDREEEFKIRNVKIAVVTFEAGFLARAYVEDTSLTWPLLVDETRRTYEDYGMIAASAWNVWGPKTWWAYLKEIRRGERIKPSEGDIYQCGGNVLVDPGGTVRLHHIGTGPSDRPTVEELLERIDAA